MKKVIKDNVLYSFANGRAKVEDDGEVIFSGEEDLYGESYIRRKKFRNKKDAILTLLNAGWFYKDSGEKNV